MSLKQLFIAVAAMLIALGSVSVCLAVEGDVSKEASDHGEGGHGHAHIGDPEGAEGKSVTEVRGDLAVWSFVVFLILLGILWKFAWRPISEALERREHNIAENIASAERVAEQAKLMMADYERRLAGAADEVRAMLEEARRDAEVTKQQIVAEAKIAAQQEHDRMLREINNAKEQALRDLAEQSANMAVDLAGRILRSQLSRQDHVALVQEALGKFASGNGSRARPVVAGRG